MGNSGVCGHSITASLCSSFLLTVFLFQCEFSHTGYSPSQTPAQILSMGNNPSGMDCSSMGPPWTTVPARKPAPAWAPLHAPNSCSCVDPAQTTGTLLQQCLKHLLPLLHHWPWCLKGFSPIFFSLLSQLLHCFPPFLTEAFPEAHGGCGAPLSPVLCPLSEGSPGFSLARRVPCGSPLSTPTLTIYPKIISSFNGPL